MENLKCFSAASAVGYEVGWIMTRKQENRYIGSSFKSFLLEQGLYEKVTVAARKRVVSWKALAMKNTGSKTAKHRCIKEL